jgi:glycerol-3-phosphate acyltransferase PlsY
MWVKFVFMLVGAYLLGSIPAAYLGVKWFKGGDIRKLGTGNVGSANVARTTSKLLAVPVALFDMGKGALAFWIAGQLGLSVGQQMAIGLIAIAGHNWSVFIGFRGGKGMVTTLGVVIAISPLMGLIVLLMAYVPGLIRQMAVGVCVTLISLPLWSWFAADWLGIHEKLPVTIGLVFIALMGFAKRLIGPRVGLSRNVPVVELLKNRFLFDRDILDRKAWIDRKPEETA